MLLCGRVGEQRVFVFREEIVGTGDVQVNNNVHIVFQRPFYRIFHQRKCVFVTIQVFIVHLFLVYRQTHVLKAHSGKFVKILFADLICTSLVIVQSTDLTIETSLIDTYVNSLSSMSIWELYTAALSIVLEMFAFKIFTILILVLSYGRIVEVFLMVSVSPIAFATLGNKEWGVIGTNYIKGLLALAFQGFFIMVLVGIYAALVEGLTTTGNLPAMAANLLVMCVLFSFGLFKTASLSKQIFTVR